MTTLADLSITEAEAAELESLSPLPQELALIRAEWLALKEQENHVKARLNEKRDALGAALEAAGLQGFTVDGRVVVRRSEVTTNALDTAKIKKDDPALFGRLFQSFAKVTKSVRVNILA
jgi:hypothetical protein